MNIDRFSIKLKEAVEGLTNATLQVGFINDATYPTGQKVAAVAFYNEFGTSKIPARPFFRRMIASENPNWGEKLNGVLKATGYDLNQSLSMLGMDIEGALRQSIIDTNDPPNSVATIAKKGFNNPLIDTSVMIKSITSEVK